MRSYCGVRTVSNRGENPAELGLIERSISWLAPAGSMPLKWAATLWLGYSQPGTPKAKVHEALWEPLNCPHTLYKPSESLTPFVPGLIMPLTLEERN